MGNKNLHLLLADDDMDDCDFFKDALDEISLPITLSTVNDGVELMNLLLKEPVNYPDLIFLDLNMPRKSGMECMAEIKTTDKLCDIPIVIYSTSLDLDVVNQLYDMGAHYYIQKPGDFASLKGVIRTAITQFNNKHKIQPPKRDEFIIQP